MSNSSRLIPWDVYSLEVSTDLQQWNVADYATAGPTGVFYLCDVAAKDHVRRFYRSRRVVQLNPSATLVEPEERPEQQ